jgi:hypothetical protein
MIILQLIYVVLNVIVLGLGLLWLFGLGLAWFRPFSFFTALLGLGKIIAVIISILFILLCIPAISIMAIIITILIILGSLCID